MSAPYSFMEHLAKSSLISRYRKDAIIAIFSAYFDASGHPDEQDVLTVAGYAATVENWIRFEDEWKDILKSEGVTSFHMTDFASSGGEYKSWKGKTPVQTARRKNFTERTAQCIEKSCTKFFRASVYIPDYNKVNADFKLEEAAGKPYALCGTQAAYMLRKWAADLGVLDTLLYYFENGDKDKNDFIRVHQAAFKREPKFLDKDEAIPFQAADFNAWKLRTALHESNKPTHTVEIGNRLLQSISLLEGVTKEAGVLNEWSLREFCKNLKIEKR